MNALTIISTYSCLSLTTGHLPMQKREKMEWRRVVEVMEPVMVPRWWRASRTSWAMKSALRPVWMPSMALVSDSLPLSSAS